MVTPESTCLFIKSSSGHFQPVVQNRCEVCEQLVDVLSGPSDENADWYITRVMADSKNGYELVHLACALKAQAEAG